MKAISKKLLSLLLTVAIVLQLLPGAVFAEESITENDNATLVNPNELTEEEILALGSSEPAPPAQILFEEEGLREADVKHYRMSDGSFHAVQFEEPVHYLDEDGTWQEINNLLTPITTYAGDTVYSVSNAEESRSFAGTLTEDAFFSLSGEGHSLSFALADLSSDHVVMGGNASALNSQEETAEPCVAEITAVAPAEPADSTAPNYLPEGYSSALTYPDVYPGIDLKYELFGYHVKESIIVKALQNDYTFDFEMNLDGLTATLLSDGSIELTDEAGTLLYYIPAPFMVDAAGNYSDAVTHSLTSLPSGGCLLRVEADVEWIEDAQLPVTIDPTIYKIVNSDSASNRKIISNYISSGNPDSNYSNGQELYAGYTNANNNAELQIISHINELPELPQGSTVNAVQISFNQSSYSNDSSSATYLLLQAHELTLTKPSTYSTYEAWINSLTWNAVHPNGAANYDDDVLDFVKMTNAGTGYAITLDLTKTAREWYNKLWQDQVPNKTLLLKTDGSATKRIVATLNMYNIYNKNYLVVAYRNDVGIEGYYTYQTQGIGRAGTGYLSDHTQRLTLVNPLIASSSNVMSFGLSLVYNSYYGTRYFDTDTDIHCCDYSGMILGAGWKLSAQECVRSVTLTGDDLQTLYWVYTDGDGTEHFFRKEGTVWKDEDGLGLKMEQVAESGHTNFKLTDDKGNEKYFRDGLLAYAKDAYGNGIYYVYNDQTFNKDLVEDTTWMPTNAVSNQLTDIYRINAGSTTAEHLAEIVYDSTNTALITGIYDEARREVFLNYTTINGVKYLTGLTYPDGQTVSYGYTSGRLTTAYDNEAGYGMEYAYEPTGQANQFREYVKNSSGTVLYGNSFSSWVSYTNRCSYRYWGKDGIKGNEDDLRTEVIFDNEGKTVCSYSTNWDISEVLGSAAATYTETSGTSRTNNRIIASGSSGMTAENLLPDSSFERGFSGWTKVCVGTNSNAAVSTATGHRRLHGAGGINLYLPTTAVEGDYAAMQKTVSLATGTYTLSGWFSVDENLTWGDNGKLEILWMNSSGSVVRQKTVIFEEPDSAIQDGWQRATDSINISTAGNYTVQFRLSGCNGTAYLDDVQLEKAAAASSYNLVQDGSFEQANGSWTLASSMSLSGTTGTKFGGYAVSAPGNPVGTVRATQMIQMDCSASTSFLLSGWAKATSAPNPSAEYGDTNRYFGLILTIKYTDNTYEFHSLPFTWGNEDWQSVSKAIAPESPEKTIDYIQVYCAYDNNSGSVSFDNISLRQEPVHTYSYNENGDPESSGDNVTGMITAEYTGTDLTKHTAKNGNVTNYTYNDQHDVLTASAAGIVNTVNYDASGNVANTKISSTTPTVSAYLYSESSSSSDKNHTTMVEDSSGHSTHYTYDSSYHFLNSATNANGQTTNHSYYSTNGRVKQTYQSGVAAVTYTYTKGRLSQLDRKTRYNDSSEYLHQYYNFTYNLWGQNTSIKVGTRTLATYTYENINSGTTGGGNLTTVKYGNNDSVTYTYDIFDRVVEMKYNDTNNYVEYLYTADSAIGEIRYKNSAGTVLSSYVFEYDSLGRLIHSSEYSGTTLVQRTEHLYDEYGRLYIQRWTIDGKARSEKYTYDDGENGDGSLVQFKSGTGHKINYNYDDLRRLGNASVTNSSGTELFKTAYAYETVSGNRTSTRVQYRNVRTTEDELITGYKYEYDELGNIEKIYQSQSPFNLLVAYTYDSQNQLTKEVHYDGAGTADSNITKSYTYAYDTAGNILSESKTEGGTTTTKTYSYTNTQWRDLLTGVTVNTGTEQTLSYDGSGNPTSYYNGEKNYTNLTWQQGRDLTSVTVGGATTTYAYDMDGIRTQKTVGGVVHTYVTQNGKLVRESFPYGTTTIIMDFIYDESGRPFAVSYSKNGGSSYTNYFYALNAQGDVEGLFRVTLNGKTGKYEHTWYGRYTYDAWGNVTATTAAGNVPGVNTLVYRNPIRYRGYVYDNETGWYYLQSRYYDPANHRFINADSAENVLYTAAMISEANLFAYCANNPVVRTDPSGDSWWGWVAAVAVVVVLAVATVVTCGGAAAAAGAVAAVASGVAASSTAATVAAGAFIGASTALAVSVVAAVDESDSLEEFADYGETALDETLRGGIFGGLNAYSMHQRQNPRQEIKGCTDNSCFIAGTLVKTTDGDIPIEEIEEGDLVWAWDEETGEVSLKRVVETYVNESYELIHVFVDGEEIITTPTHPFYCPIKGWTDAAQLRAGDILVLVNGEYVVVEKVQHELLESPVKVYNFHVEDYHTYYIACKGILVHNTCGGRELSKSELRSFGKPGNNQGYRVTEGSHSDAMNFASSQTNGLTEYAPGKFVGYNSQGVEFRVYSRDGYKYSSIRITGVEGLKGIKFLWV